MISHRVITAVLGLGVAAVILFFLRRDKLYSTQGIWWIFTAVIVALIGLFPGVFDVIGHLVGISYPPMLALLLAVCLLFIKILTMDIDRAKMERRIRVLTQRLALYEHQLDTKDPSKTPPEDREPE